MFLWYQFKVANDIILLNSRSIRLLALKFTLQQEKLTVWDFNKHENNKIFVIHIKNKEYMCI